MGPPVALARNFSGYSSMGRSRQGRWGVFERAGLALDVASAFLKERRDICVPVEMLTGLIEEDRFVVYNKYVKP